MDYSYMYVSNIELESSAVSNANNARIYKACDVMARIAESQFKKFANQFPIHGEMTINQLEYLVSRQAEWTELVTKAYNDIIRRRAAWIRVTVANPSNYNSDEIGKLADKELEVSNEWCKKMRSFLINTKNKLAKSKKLNETVINGVKVIENIEANQLQLIFDCKPDDGTIKLLHENGFFCASSIQVWQRKLTNKALHAAKLLLEKIA